MTDRLFHLLARALAAAAVLGGLSPHLAVAQAADAESAPPAAAPPPQSPPPLVAPPTTERAHPKLEDPIEARIKYLHERLRITPAQELLWGRVAQVMRENGKTVAPLIRERLQSAQHGSALESLDSYERLGEAQLEDLKKFDAAFHALYDSLSAQQKKIADAVFRMGPLSMIGGIPESPEALMAPAPGEYAAPPAAYAGMPLATYPGYAYGYGEPYPYGYYAPYYSPWFWGAPLGFSASPFFLRAHFFHHHFFHGPFVHPFHGGFHHR